MPDVFEIARLFVELARRDYADEVAIIAYYGSHATGTATEKSDLDLYYIPDDGKAVGLYRSVLLNDVPFEFWAVSWDFAERIASGRHRWKVAPSIIANARVLYARSQQDQDRFGLLQTRIASLQQPENRPDMIRQALTTFRQADYHLANMQRSGPALMSLRSAAIGLIDCLLDCLALLNQSFFTRNWASDLAQLDTLETKPDDLRQHITTLLTADDTVLILRSAGQLLADVRGLLLKAQGTLAERVLAATMFKGYYPGIREYVTKVISACEKRDLLAASYAAARLQQDTTLMLAQVEANAAFSDFNIYAEFEHSAAELGFPDISAVAARGDFEQIAAAARDYDRVAREYLTVRDVALNEAHSLDELRRLIDRG